MYRKYLFPLHIFLVLEKTDAIVWNSSKISQNSFFIYLSQNWFYTLNLMFKNELNFSNSSLIDITGFDSKELSLNKHIIASSKIILDYTYYFYKLKLRLNILINYSELNNTRLQSIDKVYSNSNWLEREVSEMYGINYIFKTDCRKLLLDYSCIENPMLKDFATEGNKSFFYSFFENQVIFQKNEIIEL